MLRAASASSCAVCSVNRSKRLLLKATAPGRRRQTRQLRVNRPQRPCRQLKADGCKASGTCAHRTRSSLALWAAGPGTSSGCGGWGYIFPHGYTSLFSNPYAGGQAISAPFKGGRIGRARSCRLRAGLIAAYRGVLPARRGLAKSLAVHPVVHSTLGESPPSSAVKAAADLLAGLPAQGGFGLLAGIKVILVSLPSVCFSVAVSP